MTIFPASTPSRMKRTAITLSLFLAFLCPQVPAEGDEGITAYFEKEWKRTGEPRAALDKLPTVHLSIVYAPDYGGHRELRVEIVNTTGKELKFPGEGRWPMELGEVRRQGRWIFDVSMHEGCGTGMGSHKFRPGESLVGRYFPDRPPLSPGRILVPLFSDDNTKASFLPLVEFPLPDEFMVRWSREIRIPEGPENRAAWEKHMLGAVDFHKRRDPGEGLPILCWWVAQLALEPGMDDGVRRVFLAAEDALLSIPGHADWIGGEIVRFATEKPHRPLVPVAAYFRVLSLLRHPASVNVLGGLLTSPHENIHEWAIRSLEEMRVVNPLLKEIENPPERKEWERRKFAWDLWFRQIRAGTRTFSFEGDPTILSLSLSGPVGRALDPGEAKPEEGTDNPGPDGKPGPGE